MNANLINEGIIELDISKNNSDNLIIDDLTIGGSLVINPKANFYSGTHPMLYLIFRKKMIWNLIILKLIDTNLGRLKT